MLSIDLYSLEETSSFGRLLGLQAKPGDIYCLDGDLGAGKTTLTRSIAEGLGIAKNSTVSSPTFALLHEYPARLPLYHMDFYRLGGSDEVLDLGFDEYWEGGGVTIIEWASRAMEILPERRVEFFIFAPSLDARRIQIQGPPQLQDRMAKLVAEFSLQKKSSGY